MINQSQNSSKFGTVLVKKCVLRSKKVKHYKKMLKYKFSMEFYYKISSNLYKEEITMSDTELLLREFGVGANYKGYQRTIMAIELAIEHEEFLCSVTKDIYLRIAKENDCTWSAVERNIRTLISRIWINPQNRIKLNRIAGYELQKSPTVTEFIDILSNYLRKKQTKSK